MPDMWTTPALKVKAVYSMSVNPWSHAHKKQHTRLAEAYEDLVVCDPINKWDMDSTRDVGVLQISLYLST